MVTIKDYKKRESEKGEFFVLVLQGEIAPVKSKSNGRMYFTAKTCTVSCTFDEESCKQLIGMQFPGEIVKVTTEPYEFALPETGEIITLEHRWEYRENSDKAVAENVVEESDVF
ncbi:hypothetical protein [Pseudotamlana carrageenivorans]|uniref:Uncharacterized protein n=1 Tax=Pseudotamlana carrageenivorans TaxID=2069432 RepID=A0A2I7SGU7_9FLAO|nr:hypothetical protein [Tamlana carrageenivorans]AUS05123.1 hypothetical protein C1A40_06410 [Tamlana carrageenivorans]